MHALLKSFYHVSVLDVGRMIEKMPGSPHLKHLPCACSGARDAPQSEAISALCVQYVPVFAIVFLLV